ncbi:MAG: aspartate carbamoyltransferase [Oligoflexia bacterium]|nr:aspartate carbamoyltransferase [Oligoflexia bacterium]
MEQLDNTEIRTKNDGLISIRDLSREDILSLIRDSQKIKEEKMYVRESVVRSNSKIASLFFENSTRTRVSSETAARNQGFYVNGFAGVEGTSVKKGEPLMDTVRMFEGYGYQAIIMRHELAGAARFAADNLNIPVINGGDGSSGHPTQTLLDLFTIYEDKQRIDGLKIALVGDLKYGRTVHSLLDALSLFDVEVYLVSPNGLNMPQWKVADYTSVSGKVPIVVTDLKEILSKLDVLYMTRIQRERFHLGIEGEAEFKKASGLFVLNRDLLERYAKKDLIVLHPLPRDKNNMEISTDVDNTPYAKYFIQAQNGLYMREALIRKIINTSSISSSTFPAKSPRALLKRSPGSLNLPIIDGQKKGDKYHYRLDEGTLIDHIEVNQGLKLYKMLDLDKISGSEVVLCTNIRSKQFERKDVLAIHKLILSTQQLYKIALLSPKHTINIIKGQRVIKKERAILPSPLYDLLICNNPLCISRSEHNEFARSIFYVESDDPLQVRCHYCEEIFSRKEISIAY